MWNPFVMVARGLALLVVGFFLMSAVASAASAAPQRLASDPQEGAELDEPPERVSITFSEPLLEGSELQVLDECGRRVDDDLPQIMANVMSVGIVEESSGTYRVSYTAVGPTGTGTGRFTFTVHGGAACDPASGDHHGADSGGGHGGGGGAGSGGSEPGHSGSEAGHNQDSTDVGGDGATVHANGDHDSGVGATHTVGDAGDHAAARGRTDAPDHRSPEGSDATASDSPAASSYGGSGARWRTETGAPLWPTIAGFAIAGLFGVAGGWLLRGSRLRSSSGRR
jgi:methionine-rich copper-binding protein CopC